MGTLTSCRHVSTVRLHHLDFNEMLRQKARWELYKDSAYCFEKIQKTAPYKIAFVQPITSHLTNHSSKNKLINDVLWTPTHGPISVGWLSKTYIHQLCADIRCHLEDFLSAMTDKDGWQERERAKRIHAISMPGWW